MKKFEFELEKLLSYKTQILDNELMVLADLNSQSLKAQQRLQLLENNREKYGLELNHKMKETITPEECSIYGNYRVYLKQQKELIESELEQLAKLIEDKLIEIKKLKLETKSLETLKESRVDDYNKMNLKNSEHQMDEFVSTVSAINKDL